MCKKCDDKNSVPTETERLLQESKMQWTYVKKLDLQIKKWSPQIFCTEYVPTFGERLCVYIFYKKDKDLKKYTADGTVEATKEKILNILREIGYMERFNDCIHFSFDSDEHVQRNYRGNYGLRLTDD